MSDRNPVSSPNKVHSFLNVEDKRVRAYLNQRLDKLQKHFDDRSPELKSRVKRCSEMLQTMPPFWKELPGAAQVELRSYTSKLSEQQKSDLASVCLSAFQLNGKLVVQQKKTPTMVTLLNLLNELAKNPNEERPTFNREFQSINEGINIGVLSRNKRQKAYEARLETEVLVKPATDEDVETKPSQRKKKHARLSYDPAKIVPLRKLPDKCVANNPQFHVFAYYKWKAALAGVSYPTFDAIIESQVLPNFSRLQGSPIESVRKELEAIARQPIRFSEFIKDPYKMLDEKFSLAEDQGQLMPALMKMVVQARIQVEVQNESNYRPIDGRKIFQVYDTPYLESQRFKDDYEQLQVALNQMASESPLKKALSSKSPPPARTAKETEEVLSSPPKSDAEEKPKSARRPRKAATTTTTTTTATTTTTTASVVGSKNQPEHLSVASPAKGAVGLTPSSSIEVIVEDAEVVATCRVALEYGGKLCELFGMDAAFGAIKLADAARLTADKNKGKFKTVNALLKQALADAHLTGDQQRALKTVGEELKKDTTKLGRTQKAVGLADFLIDAQVALKSDS